MALAIRSNSKISYSILSVGAFTATLAVRETAKALGITIPSSILLGADEVIQ